MNPFEESLMNFSSEDIAAVIQIREKFFQLFTDLGCPLLFLDLYISSMKLSLSFFPEEKEMEYRISWRSAATGESGHESWQHKPRKYVEYLARYYNEINPDIYHWVEEQTMESSESSEDFF